MVPPYGMENRSTLLMKKAWTVKPNMSFVLYPMSSCNWCSYIHFMGLQVMFTCLSTGWSLPVTPKSYQQNLDLPGDIPREILLHFNLPDNTTEIAVLYKVETTSSAPYMDSYDQRGAMLFAISVVSFYGLSIGIFIATSLRRDTDQEDVKAYLRKPPNFETIRRDHEKGQARLALRKHEQDLMFLKSQSMNKRFPGRSIELDLSDLSESSEDEESIFGDIDEDQASLLWTLRTSMTSDPAAPLLPKEPDEMEMIYV